MSMNVLKKIPKKGKLTISQSPWERNVVLCNDNLWTGKLVKNASYRLELIPPLSAAINTKPRRKVHMWLLSVRKELHGSECNRSENERERMRIERWMTEFFWLIVLGARKGRVGSEDGCRILNRLFALYKVLKWPVARSTFILEHLRQMGRCWPLLPLFSCSLVRKGRS